VQSQNDRPFQHSSDVDSWDPVEIRSRVQRLEVRDPEAAKALFDTKQRVLFAPFFAAPTTVSEAAEATSTLPSTMLYFIRRMVALGLLEVTDQVRRSGKLVNQYRAAADEYYLPIEVTEEFLLWPNRRFQNAFNEGLREEILHHHYNVAPLGALIRPAANGVVQLTGALPTGDWIPGENGPRVFFEWTMLRLDPDAAKSFLQELSELSNRYLQLPYGEDAFYVGLQFAPVPDTHELRSYANSPAD
jgi:hypothetical protein